MIEIEVSGSFRAHAEDGRAFVIIEYTEYRVYMAKGLTVRVPTGKHYETSEGSEVIPGTDEGQFRIADLQLLVQFRADC